MVISDHEFLLQGVHIDDQQGVSAPSVHFKSTVLDARNIAKRQETPS